MKGVYIDDGGGRVKWLYLPDALRVGVLGVYADEETGGEFARICRDERRAQKFFDREQMDGNSVYFWRVWSSGTPRRVISIGD